MNSEQIKLYIQRRMNTANKMAAVATESEMRYQYEEAAQAFQSALDYIGALEQYLRLREQLLVCYRLRRHPTKRLLDAMSKAIDKLAQFDTPPASGEKEKN